MRVYFDNPSSTIGHGTFLTEGGQSVEVLRGEYEAKDCGNYVILGSGAQVNKVYIQVLNG